MELISISFLTPFPLSLYDVHKQPNSEEVSSVVGHSSGAEWLASQDFLAQISATYHFGTVSYTYEIIISYFHESYFQDRC